MPQQLPNPDRRQWPQLILRRTDQAAIALLSLGSILAIALWCFWQSEASNGLIDIDRAEPLAVAFKIDINQADWPELALLPNVGEQLAKRIVADRAAQGPYERFSDLERIRGIGPRTIDAMRPFLLPLETPQTPITSAPAKGATVTSTAAQSAGKK